MIARSHYQYLEITDVIFFVMDGYIGRFAHPIRDVKPFDQVTVLGDTKDCGRYGIDRYNMALVIDGQAGHDIDVAK